MKPLLAHTVTDTAKIKYPVFASVKLDGIRCLVVNGKAVSRKLLDIPNVFIRQVLSAPEFESLDGELVVGKPNAPDVYNQSYRGVMTQAGEPNFTFYVFDRLDMDTVEFSDRYRSLRDLQLVRTVVLPQVLIFGEEELLAFEAKAVADGYEGIMVRSLDGIRKDGRSTEKQGILGKVKRFTDDEFEIVGFEERMHNANAATKDELGNTKRSTHMENLVGRGDLGAIILKCDSGTFNCGSGFNDEQRAEIWANRDKYLGSLATVKHFLVGVKDKPRFPTFKGFRSPIDMGEPA